MSNNTEPQNLPIVKTNEWKTLDFVDNLINSPEEDRPFGCKNSWIIKSNSSTWETFTVHYCPLCDKLEVCADDVCDYDKGIFPCNFSTRYGFHPECFFKKPFLSTDGKQFFGDNTMSAFDLMLNELNRNGTLKKIQHGDSKNG